MRRVLRSRSLLAALACGLAAQACYSGEEGSQTGTMTGTGSTSGTSSVEPTTGAGTAGPTTTTTTTTSTTGGSEDATTQAPDVSSSATSEPATSEPATTEPVIPDLGVQCLAATDPCVDASQCCAVPGLTCANTTLGQVCCGVEGTGCVTPNGEDCCGDLLCVAGTCLSPGGTPPFKSPYPCGQSWTYSHHDMEVRRALDFIDNGGNTNNAPVLAALDGVATRKYQEGGAGNYIVIDHGGGWTTYYFHLQSYSVEDGAVVTTGQEVGRVGSTGASSGPHLHFEELYYGEGKDIWLDGEAFAPYPGSYGQSSHTSQNCP